MDEMYLRQWNVTDYLSCYPYSYFESLVAKKELYGAFEEGKLIGIAALFSSDERWQGAEDALYVHHLAVLPGYSGTRGGLAVILRTAGPKQRKKLSSPGCAKRERTIK